MDNSVVLISCAVLFKTVRGKDVWFLVRQSEEGKFEIAKTVARKGESSVRASLRMIGEQGGITGKVLEEAGRAGGVTSVNNKVLPQRHIYYLMSLVDEEGEAIGFEEFVWLEYSAAIRKLSSKRERAMLKQARKELAAWRKRNPELNDDGTEKVE